MDITSATSVLPDPATDHYFLLVADGYTGNGISFGGALPSGAVICTYEQYLNASAWTVKDGAIVAAEAS